MPNLSISFNKEKTLLLKKLEKLEVLHKIWFDKQYCKAKKPKHIPCALSSLRPIITQHPEPCLTYTTRINSIPWAHNNPVIKSRELHVHHTDAVIAYSCKKHTHNQQLSDA